MRAQDQRSRRMVQAAAGLFLRKGYQLNMTEVAQAAGVARQTVYAHFGSKHALLEAAVGELVTPLRDALGDGHRDLRQALIAFARGHLQRALNPRTVALARRLIGEAGRFPREARSLYDSGYGSVHRVLAQRLAQAHDDGELVLADADRAAEMLIGLLNGLDGDRRRLGLPMRGTTARARWLREAVDLFLRAHAPAAARGSRRSRNAATGSSP